MAIAIFGVIVLFENDLQPATGRQPHAFAQSPLTAKAIEHAGDSARVLSQLGGFPFEAVNLLDDFYRYKDVVFVEAKQRIGIVQQNIGIKNVIFHV
jgi:hypothetical protein